MNSKPKTPYGKELRTTYKILETFCNSMPKDIFDNVKGIIVLTIFKSGVIGIQKGSGVLLKNINEKLWSGPLFINLQSSGISMSIPKTKCLLIIKNEKILQNLIENKEFNLDQVTIRHTEDKNDTNNELILYLLKNNVQDSSLSLERDKIIINDDYITQFYSNSTEPHSILSGTVKVPKNRHYKKMIELLNENFTKTSLSSSTSSPLSVSFQSPSLSDSTSNSNSNNHHVKHDSFDLDNLTEKEKEEKIINKIKEIEKNKLKDEITIDNELNKKLEEKQLEATRKLQRLQIQSINNTLNDENNKISWNDMKDQIIEKAENLHEKYEQNPDILIKLDSNNNINEENLKDFKRPFESLDRTESAEERENFCNKNFNQNDKNKNKLTDKISDKINKLFHLNKNSNNEEKNLNQNEIIKDKIPSLLMSNNNNNSNMSKDNNSNNNNANKNNISVSSNNNEQDKNKNLEQNQNKIEDNNENTKKYEKKESLWSVFKDKLTFKNKKSDLKEDTNADGIHENFCSK